MELKNRNLSGNEKRELQKQLLLAVEKAQQEGLPAGVILDRELKQGLKEINMEVKKETAEQYRNLVQAKINKDKNADLKSFLLECNTRNSFDKTRTALRFCITEKIAELRKESENARRAGDKDLMQSKTREAYQMYYTFQKDFLSGEKIVWGDISYKKNQSASKKKTMNSVSTIKAVFEDLKTKPDLFDKYGMALAISSLTGCRPSELMKGISLELEGQQMHISISGAKVGKDRGQDERKISFNMKDFKSNEPMNYILSKFLPGNNSYEYQLDRKDYNSLRQYLHNNHRGFSLYTLRHRVASDLKKEGFDPVNLAAFLGHRTTRSQENYGYAKSGKGGPGVAGVECSNQIKDNQKRYGRGKNPGVGVKSKWVPKG